MLRCLGGPGHCGVVVQRRRHQHRERKPGARKVDRYSEVLCCRMAEAEDAEHVKGVVSVVCQGEGVDDGVEADREEHAGEDEC